MDKETKDFLDMLSRAETITNEGDVDNETRTGSYIKIKAGLLTKVFFVGKNEEDQTIAEYVNG